MGCNNEKNQINLEIPKSEQSVNRLLHQISVLFDKKYKLKTRATNVSMPDGEVKLLGLDFQIRGPLSRGDLRKILLQLEQEFLEIVNSDETIRPYLQIYPFKTENIDITLFVVDSRGIVIEDPNIGIAAIARGKLVYKTVISGDTPHIESEFEETYEEALKASMSS